jgi:hypothetical protein
MHENADQDRVLDHIGEVAGVKGVAIIHARDSWPQIHRCQSRRRDAIAAMGLSLTCNRCGVRSLSLDRPTCG